MTPIINRKFFIANEEDILQGRTTDIYFKRTLEVLKAKGLMDVQIAAELTVSGLPRDWTWGVYCGLEEVLRLFEGKDIDIWGLPEGTIFPSRTQSGIRLPLMVIEGAYSHFCLLESPMLGMLSHSSGVATMASRCRKAAGDLPMIAFGVRRAHPAIAPMLDRSSYIGGCDGVSSILGSELLGREADGTMPHALILIIGQSVDAFRAFDEVMGPEVPRIVLADTYSDEKVEALAAAETIDLYGVRLDTPSSRRGSFPDIVREVRWELDLHGHKDVNIILSGGLDETTIPPLVQAGASGFGIGSSISSAPSIDFALDIVEKEGVPIAKKGKYGGRKYLYRCPNCLDFEVSLTKQIPICRNCNIEMINAEVKLMERGKRIVRAETPDAIRDRVLTQLSKMVVE
ncbi:MAG: nicotinate phosphoribosyltransferase [Euryarchaeota archaeon]|nr:nicotinate phosphoribosyltransferase [Euryarchaeota archaeon]